MERTEPVSLEEKVAILERQLMQAQRLTAMGELASTITHEFNNILTTTINYAKMGLRHKDTPTRDKAFEKILAAGERAAKITNTILGFARNKGDRREPTDLARLVNDTLVLLERDLSKYRIHVETNLAQVPLALVTGNQIQQVLVNLLINARQAMSSGGRVTISLQHEPGSAMIELKVRDNGSGIPAERLPRIFDRYYTTKTPDASGKGGTGLGLAMCRDVIEAHQGRIRVESSVGRGTAFILKLPVAPVSNAAPAAPVATPTDLPAKSA